MALFQIFSGREEDLSTDFSRIAFHEGYAYFCKDTGAFYIDATVNGTPTRVPISGHGLLDDEGVLTNYDQFLQLSDKEIIETEVRTKVYEHQTLVSSGWDINTRQQTISTLLGLRCGSEGKTSPFIICESNIEDYSKIDTAVATRATSSATNGSIVFTLKEGATVSGNIVITIIDFG